MKITRRAALAVSAAMALIGRPSTVKPKEDSPQTSEFDTSGVWSWSDWDEEEQDWVWREGTFEDSLRAAKQHYERLET